MVRESLVPSVHFASWYLTGAKNLPALLIAGNLAALNAASSLNDPLASSNTALRSNAVSVGSNDALASSNSVFDILNSSSAGNLSSSGITVTTGSTLTASLASSKLSSNVNKRTTMMKKNKKNKKNKKKKKKKKKPTRKK